MINLNRFDLVSLRLYAAVVETGSLTAGAARFGISLAAASKRMVELERDVGTALLKKNKNPSEGEIRAALAGNLCRCGTHQRITTAVQRAAKAA